MIKKIDNSEFKQESIKKILEKINAAKLQLRNLQNKNVDVVHFLGEEFHLADVASLNATELMRVAELCILGKLISIEHSDQTSPSPPKACKEYVRDIFFEIEAILIVDIGLDGMSFDRAAGERFSLSELQIVVEKVSTESIQPEPKLANPMSTCEFIDLGDVNTLFKQRTSALNSKHKINNQHPWNKQLMQDSSITLHAFYDSLDQALNRVDDNNIEVLTDFIAELSILLKKYTQRHHSTTSQKDH
jgi:hypothetical protein